MRQRFVAVLDSDPELDLLWLQRSLGPDAEILAAAEANPRRVEQLIEAGSCGLVFVSVSEATLNARVGLIEDLLARKPSLVVVALGASDDVALVLASMRAGARDFALLGSDPAVLRHGVERLLKRTPHHEAAEKGRSMIILCPRPDTATSVLATHLGLALAELGGDADETLLVDLGLPDADSLLFLDLKASYSFVDAVRSVRRFDETLIRTAFARHESGLAVLPRSDEQESMQALRTEDAFALVGVLRSFFANVVVNLAGMRNEEVIAEVLSKDAEVLLVADQSVVTCRAARRLLDAMVQRGCPLERVRLVVDRYTPKLQPESERIAEVLCVPLLATLPACGIVKIEAMNTGRSIFELAARSPYAKAIRALAAELTGPRPAPKLRLLERLASSLGRKSSG